MNSNHRPYRARLILPLLLAFLLPAAMSITAAASDSDLTLISSGTTPISETETTAKPNNSTSVSTTQTVERKTAPAVSYGLRVMAARDELVFSGLVGNEITFTAEDICRVMNLSSLDYITVVELPDAEDGTLYVGSVGAAKGQVITAGSLKLMSFASSDEEKPGEATMKIAVNGADYAMTCRFCTLSRLNYTPTVALAPSISLNVETYRNIPIAGTVSAYDPEGDEMTFEIVRYASHGRVSIIDPHTGAYTYTPDATYVGKDSFDYVVRDKWGNYSTSATVSIRISTPPASVTYSDIDGHDNAAAILDISSMGLMNGTRVGNDAYFKPDLAVSRVEFLVTAMQAAGIGQSRLANFGDPSVSDCEDIPAAMRPYVSYALQKNYVGTKTLSGKSYFRPDDTITHAEAAVILSNIIGYAIDDTVTAFADASSVPAWSEPALTSLSALGIMTSPDGKANASTTLTRATTAAWLSKTIQLMQG